MAPKDPQGHRPLSNNQHPGSIVARKIIKKGQIIKKNMLDFKRPGTGLQPSNINRIIGKRIKRNIQFDEILKEEDF